MNVTRVPKPPVVIVSHSLTLTGAPKVALDVALYLSSFSRVVLLNLNPQKEQLALPANSSITVHSFPAHLFLDNNLFVLLDRLLRLASNQYLSLKKLWFLLFLLKARPVLTIFNTFYHHDLQDLPKYLLGKSVRYLHEDSYFLKSLSPSQIKSLNKSDCLFGCSPTVVSDSRDLGLNVNKRFIPFSTDTLIPNLYSLPTKAPSPDSILSVGSDLYRKGFDYVSQLANVTTSSIHWYGETPSPNPHDSVLCQGYSRSIPYKHYSIYLFLSRSDPWPLSVLEAISHKLIVIGWAHLPLMSELSRHHIGHSVDSYNLKQLTDCVNKLVQSPCYPTTSSVRNFLNLYTQDINLLPFRDCLP